MSTTPSVYQNDINPTVFVCFVFFGSIGSIALSAANFHAAVSVGFAVSLMFILAGMRWAAAKKSKDSESLDAFADDIYLLGYLLTLGALLGLAPRLTSEDENLFKIAGLKLVTTVVGLALMMVFRQAARRWSDDTRRIRADAFVEQQQRFSEAVAKLNDGADALTAKLGEVINRFDPTMLVPVADWSNRAAAAFSEASKALQDIPPSLEAGKRNLDALSDDLLKAKSAAGELAGAFTTGTTQAAHVLTGELSKTKDALNGLIVTLTTLQPAGDNASQAIQKLGQQASPAAAKLLEVGMNFEGTVEELKKAERTLKKLLELHSLDPETPLNRLVQALDASASKTALATDRFETIQRDMRDATTAIQGLAKKIESQTIASHNDMAAVATQVLKKLDELSDQLGQTNERLKALPVRSDGSLNRENRNKFWWSR